MTPSDLQQLLQVLGCDRIRVKSNGWVTSTCPFAPWTHGGGVDHSPSFGVLSDPAGGGYRCLACKRHGPLHRLPVALQGLGGAKLAAAASRFIRTRAVLGTPEIKQRVQRSADRPPVRAVAAVKPLTDFLNTPEVPVIPDGDLWHFEKLPPEVLALPVCTKRTILPRSYEDWQIRWHEQSGRIAIPTRDERKRIVGIAGRLGDDRNCHGCKAPYVEVLIPHETDPSKPPKKRQRCPLCNRFKPPKYLHTQGFKRDLFLFGEDRVQRGTRLHLVEGQFDTVGIRQWGYNALGIMGSYVSDHQARKIVAWASEVVIVSETDKAGVQLAESAAKMLGPYVPTAIRPLPKGDADELSEPAARELLGEPNLARK